MFSVPQFPSLVIENHASRRFIGRRTHFFSLFQAKNVPRENEGSNGVIKVSGGEPI